MISLIKRSQSATALQDGLSERESSITEWTTFLAKRGLRLLLTSLDFSSLSQGQMLRGRIDLDQIVAQIKTFQCIENGTHISLAFLSERAKHFLNLSDVGVISFAQECLEPHKQLLIPAPQVKILRVDLDMTVRLGHARQMLGEQFASAVASALPGLGTVQFSVGTSMVEQKARDIIIAVWVKIGELLPAVQLCFKLKRGQGRKVWSQIFDEMK
ncbi:hypothetical protein M427DRAFT_500009 [Gonapodya prolifera JEL478]|uniref:Uncharacterized protein n=1 Tax=Gonapodya prolifera (strain JEL478) TaxID=1344416 RepID=A0A139ABA6_GONPJ|nr:hypothetical protein M427DRAFT_500009 [Gonapodya prolifera JEL478]|eukprot:KXS13745.1 hypothetical protein M427DRAFT_500009 [Gonapodya prolifera JEL478]